MKAHIVSQVKTVGCTTAFNAEISSQPRDDSRSTFSSKQRLVNAANRPNHFKGSGEGRVHIVDHTGKGNMNGSTACAWHFGGLQDFVRLAEFRIVYVWRCAGEFETTHLWTRDAIVDVMEKRNQCSCVIQQILKLSIQDLTNAWAALGSGFIQKAICFSGREVIAKYSGLRMKQVVSKVIWIVIVHA